jgi:hypothetical protein
MVVDSSALAASHLVQIPKSVGILGSFKYHVTVAPQTTGSVLLLLIFLQPVDLPVLQKPHHKVPTN